MQEAALELSLPEARIGGLAVSRREAAGGGALSGVMNCLAAQVVAGRARRFVEARAWLAASAPDSKPARP